MKHSILILSVIIILISINRVASAQAYFNPVFEEGESEISLQLGYSQLIHDLSDFVNDDGSFTRKQDVFLFGVNWSQYLFNGFSHIRSGAFFLNGTENDIKIAGPDLIRFNEDQRSAFYLGGGYNLLYEIFLPSSDSKLQTETNENLQTTRLFVSIGIDFNGYIYSGSDGSMIRTIYVGDIALISMLGVRCADLGLQAFTSVSFHNVVFWDDRSKADYMIEHIYEDYDLSLPIGVEVGISYDVPGVEWMRISLIGKFRNTNTILISIGYVI